VGKFTRAFDAGLNAFSLPLEPLTGHDLEWFANSIANTVYIDWMDSSDHWVRQYKGDPAGRPGALGIGEGFQIFLSAASTFTFVGTPAAMIRYQEGLGAPQDFRRALTVQAAQDDIELYWKTATGASGYNIYRTDDRMAFHMSTLTPVATLGAGANSWTDLGALATDASWYYMVIPIKAGGTEGSSTYSIGVISVSYKAGHNSIGLPLKPAGWWTLDHYCEGISGAIGIAYMTMGVWKFHATEMPALVYDPFIEQGNGYQISIDGQPSGYTFIGY